ncbi:MAG: type II toxin-antitoxin system PemK/MazF family toxin [Rickettsia endosymbiont of Eriopis connexa]|nr:type II toxin-antitoxin system PemK/MazF family toxin [Rickettsia endosymbiont of Eriopis connexa]
MKRGEVWWVIFDPSLGGKISKTRPAIIISNDAANETLNRFIPLTTNVNKCYPWEVYVVINDQITTASKLRLKSKISVITNNEMQSLEYALKCISQDLILQTL